MDKKMEMLALGEAHMLLRTRSGDMKIQLAGTGTATINWGDGSEVVTHVLLPCEGDWDKETAIHHKYPDWSSYNMTITGENITHLDCSRNYLVVKLDVSQNTALKVLLCGNNRMRTLDVSQNTALTQLDCSDNRLKVLDVSLHHALEELNCAGNQLTALNVSQNTALKVLYCNRNELTALDVSLQTALEELNCGGNSLTALDVSRNTVLKRLECWGNQLTTLDVSQNVALTSLECWRNQLTSLDVSQNTALEELKCGSNPLTALDISRNTALTMLNCYDTLLTELDVSQNAELTSLYCKMRQLGKTPEFAGMAMTMTTTSKSNPDDFNMKAGRIPPPDIEFYLQGTGYATIDWNDDIHYRETVRLIEIKGREDGLGATQFTKHYFSSPNTITITGENITVLRCNGNQLTALDVSQNTALKELRCSNNQLKELDVSYNIELENLNCECNQLMALDVSKNTALNRMVCHGNQLTAAALNALFMTMPDVSDREAFIYENPGTDDCDASIAEKKGWKVIKEWNDE